MASLIWSRLLGSKMQVKHVLCNCLGYLLALSAFLMISPGCGSGPNNQFPLNQPSSKSSTDSELDVCSAAVEDAIQTRGLTGESVVVEAETISPPDVPEYVLDELKAQGYEADSSKLSFVDSPSRVLTPELSLSLPYRLVPGAYLEEVFRNGSWKRFASEFPDAKTLIGISKPHFYDSGERALLYMTVVSGPLDGSRGFVVMHKTDGQWKVVRFLLVGVS